MTSNWGELALWLTFTNAGLMILLPLWTQTTQSLIRLSQWQCISHIAALFFLFIAFIHNDFSFAYVAKHGNINLPIGYKLSAVWAGHEGSLLLWLTMLSVVLAVSLAKSTAWANTRLIRAAISLSGLVLVSTIGFALFTSNPFVKNDFLPANGADLNPLLQDPALIFHPPLLFLGYVCTAPSFVWMVAALLSHSYPDALFVHLRQWVRLGWVMLTIGIALGSFWAYYELGWGGYWFWDPVENAALLPWFFATALLHAIGQKNMRQWTALFAISTFLLSILATFLIRSGILVSVHSFAADSSRGSYLLFILLLFSLPGLILMVLRLDELQSAKQSSLYLNINQVLCLVAGFTVLLGTLAPVAFDVIFHQAISVGAPYFNQMMMPLWVVAIGFLTAMSWHSGAWRWCVVAILLASVFFVWALPNLSDSPLAIVLLTLTVVCAATTLTVKQPLTVKIGHSGFFIMSIGLIASSYFSQTHTVAVTQNQSLHFAHYDIKWLHESQSTNAIYQSYQAHFEVSHNSIINVLSPEKRRYHIGGQVLSETAILPTFTHDLLISLGNMDDKTSNWRVRLQFRPLVRWVWLGALVMAAAVLLRLYNRVASIRGKNEY